MLTSELKADLDSLRRGDRLRRGARRAVDEGFQRRPIVFKADGPA